MDATPNLLTEFLDQLPVSAPLLVLAAAAVLSGARMFGAGLRVLRLSRVFAGLRESALEPDTSGLVTVRGRVVLDSPMFAPLSGQPCAGFTLEVAGDRMRVGGQVCELRAFRLVGEHASARVVTDRAHWAGGVTSERTVFPGEGMPERLARLLDESSEVRWLRDRGVTLRLTERVLEVGADVYVTGMARSARADRRARPRAAETAVAMVESLELAATGTDGATWTVGEDRPASFGSEPELWIEADAPLERLVVSTDPPTPGTLAPPLWKLMLMLVGPALALAGLLYLARVAAPLVAGRV
jgi:hypothetical protein